MLKTAGGGAIVCMASAAEKYGYAFRTPYSSARFGIAGDVAATIMFLMSDAGRNLSGPSIAL